MVRALHIEFTGACYHATLCGGGRDYISLQDEDQDRRLNVPERVCERFNWVIDAYC